MHENIERLDSRRSREDLAAGDLVLPPDAVAELGYEPVAQAARASAGYGP